MVAIKFFNLVLLETTVILSNDPKSTSLLLRRFRNTEGGEGPRHSMRMFAPSLETFAELKRQEGSPQVRHLACEPPRVLGKHLYNVSPTGITLVVNLLQALNLQEEVHFCGVRTSGCIENFVISEGI